jgi:hypothetical protein
MVAPFVVEGAMNGPMFLAYVKQCLAPTLRRGDIVIMDNVPVHRVDGVARPQSDRAGHQQSEG